MTRAIAGHLFVLQREILISLMDQAKSDEVWLGAGNLLANTRAAGFAARLMNEITIHAAVTVINGERRGFGGGVGGSAIGCSGPLPPPPPRTDWPEAGQYALTLIPNRRDSLLAWGNKPVYYTRVLGHADYHPWQEPQSSSSRDSYRLGYLAQFMEKAPASRRSLCVRGLPSLGPVRKHIEPKSKHFYSSSESYSTCWPATCARGNG